MAASPHNPDPRGPQRIRDTRDTEPLRDTRDVDREVKEMPRDLAKVPEIGKRHQIRFVR